jgi:hypothetical protein
MEESKQGGAYLPWIVAPQAKKSVVPDCSVLYGAIRKHKAILF